MHRLISANECSKWRAALAAFSEVDATFLPEYHLAYALRVRGARPLLWHFSRGGEHFVYPFLLTPVILNSAPTGHFDISSVYGYTGPLATDTSDTFRQAAWEAFDTYAAEQKIVAEFIRFSPFHRNEQMAHPQTAVSLNRSVAVSHLPANEDALLALLGPKTRNILRKAARGGLTARELPVPDELPAFRILYEETMMRNRAPEFFWYGDSYWHNLVKLGRQELRLFGAYAQGRLVAGSMSIAHGQSGLYHLGASLPEYAPLGAGNLSLFAMSCGLMRSGVTFINMTGGRTTNPDDPLLLFKRRNATSMAPFHIGRRVVDHDAYDAIAASWQQLHGSPPGAERIIFWRP